MKLLIKSLAIIYPIVLCIIYEFVFMPKIGIANIHVAELINNMAGSKYINSYYINIAIYIVLLCSVELPLYFIGIKFKVFNHIKSKTEVIKVFILILIGLCVVMFIWFICFMIRFSWVMSHF